MSLVSNYASFCNVDRKLSMNFNTSIHKNFDKSADTASSRLGCGSKDHKYFSLSQSHSSFVYLCDF